MGIGVRKAAWGLLALVAGCADFTAQDSSDSGVPLPDAQASDGAPETGGNPPKDAAAMLDVAEVTADVSVPDFKDASAGDGNAPLEAGPSGDAGDAGKGPGCGSGLTSCSAGCVDLQNDSANCGACGKTCSTASSCSSGVCDAELVIKVTAPVDVYADDTTLWWNRQNSIERCTRTNCTSGATLWPYAGYTSVQSRFAYVLPAGQSAGTFFFGASYGGADYMSKCKTTSCVPTNVGPVPTSISADESDAFFASGNSIYRLPFAGTSSIKFLDLSFAPSNLAVSSAALWWTSAQNGGVYASARSSATATQVVSSSLASGATAFHVTGSDLFFADNAGGNARILSCPLSVAACTPTVVATNEKLVGSILVSAGYLYWTTWGSSEFASGTIRACKLSSCVPFNVALGLAFPTAMSTGSFMHLYFAARGISPSGGGGGIYRVVKPQ